MKIGIRNTPRNKAFIIALIITLLYAIKNVICYVVNGEISLWISLISGVVLFAATFIIIITVFRRFIKKSIHPIYRKINNVSIPEKEMRKLIDSGEITVELFNEVELWSRAQTAEIQKLRQMEEYRKDFLGNVSHEMKTPIFNIQGYILTLLDGGMNDKKINKLYLQRTEKSINRLISTVDDLESISSLESGEFKLKFDKFNIVKLVEEVFETQEMLANKYNIKLEFDGKYFKSLKVQADRARIQEVLNNLVVNSIKYGKNNGKTKIGFQETDYHIYIEVGDNGIGIDEDNLPRIFERFFRVDKSRSRDTGGTGLGLSIVKHVLQAHKQEIHVSSNPGKGTTFIFSLEKA